MNRSFALRPVLSCSFVWNAAWGGLQQGSTVGGRDKRPGALRCYGVVVVGFLGRCAQHYSATPGLNPLIAKEFFRATPLFEGNWP
jgi:hypothetical protein